MSHADLYLAVFFILTQVVAFGGGVFAALRMMNTADALKAAHTEVLSKATQAERDSNRALQELVTLRTKNYEDLRDHVLNVETVARRAEKAAEAIEESWRQLQAKEAARANREKRIAREEAASAEVYTDPPQANGHVTPGLPPGFGKIIGRTR